MRHRIWRGLVAAALADRYRDPIALFRHAGQAADFFQDALRIRRFSRQLLKADSSSVRRKAMRGSIGKVTISATRPGPR